MLNGETAEDIYRVLLDKGDDIGLELGQHAVHRGEADVVALVEQHPVDVLGGHVLRRRLLLEDISAACAGFIFAMNIVEGFFKAGIYKTALIIGAETLSKVTDWSDRGTCVLFGDGAGAAVLKAEETGIIDMMMGADGTKGDVLACTSRTVGNFLTGTKPELGFMTMDGQEVFKFAVRKVPESVMELLQRTGTKKEDIKYYVLHQANERIIEAAARRLKEPMEKFPMTISQFGNTSTASIPLLLDDMIRKDMLKKGDKIIMSGFGAGMTWGAVLMEW